MLIWCDSKCYLLLIVGPLFCWVLSYLLANFQRDGRAVHDDNQGNRPNYPSTQETLNLPTRAYNDANHTIWVSSFSLLVIKLMAD